MNSTTIRSHIFDFIKLNKRLPQYLAMSVDDFYKYKAAVYIPGIKQQTLEDFKRHGFTFNYRYKGKGHRIEVIWKESVIC